MAVCQKVVPLVNIKIAGKWMFIPLKMVLIGIDPYPYQLTYSVYNASYMLNVHLPGSCNLSGLTFMEIDRSTYFWTPEPSKKISFILRL